MLDGIVANSTEIIVVVPSLCVFGRILGFPQSFGKAVPAQYLHQCGMERFVRFVVIAA